MTRFNGSRRSVRYVAGALTAVIALGLCACSKVTPNTTLTPHSEFGREIDQLFDKIFIAGMIVFVLVEVGLLYTVFRFRHRPGAPEPEHVHGNTTLEITWTVIPALVLAFIAVPTVRTIFRTQAKAVSNALQVEVIGHQWWWEFRYPQFGVTTANELYLPVGRTANFILKTQDVIHSFWIPEVAGKRDLVSNHTNYIWFTPESAYVWNGFCAEYCGASHSLMRFRAFTVTPAEFDHWIAHQKSAAVGAAMPGAPGAAAGAPAGAAPAAAATAQTPGARMAADTTQKATSVAQAATSTAQTTPAASSAGPVVASAQITDTATYTFPRERLPRHVVPATPTPAGLTVADNLAGDPARGRQAFLSSACIGCHTIQGTISMGVAGPNLTHVGSRTTIAGAIYPNDKHHLMLWIKNAPMMKPGSLMPALGKSAQVPGGLSDQQIADIAAYLSSLR